MSVCTRTIDVQNSHGQYIYMQHLIAHCRHVGRSHHLVLIWTSIWDAVVALLACSLTIASVTAYTAHNDAMQAVSQHHGEATLQHLQMAHCVSKLSFVNLHACFPFADMRHKTQE